MAGDGVNDILAMREADCSITVGEAVDAARQTAKIVLLNSDLSSLLTVLSEGRRVVNNITRVAGVFFIKTVYSILLSLLCLITNTQFPFIPIQITLINLVIEGYPAFFMSFEPDNRKITRRFLPSVLRNAFPNGLTIAIMVSLILLWAPTLGIAPEQSFLMAYLILGSVGMQGVLKACIPFNKLYLSLVLTMMIGFSAAVYLFHHLLQFPSLDSSLLPLTIALVALSLVVERVLNFFCKRFWAPCSNELIKKLKN